MDRGSPQVKRKISISFTLVTDMDPKDLRLAEVIGLFYLAGPKRERLMKITRIDLEKPMTVTVVRSPKSKLMKKLNKS